MQPLLLQPIPYQGSKRALAPRICGLFPSGIDTLYEPFAGSAAITLYAAHHGLAKAFVIGDICSALTELWHQIIENPTSVADLYRAVWREQFDFGLGHFNDIRRRYNSERNPIFLLYLITRCVKNAIRFNKNGDFTQSVDRRRKGMHPDKMANTVFNVSRLLKGRTRVFKGDFQKCVEHATPIDLVYMDPPYQGTTYGRDKRYAAQLERERLFDTLHWLNSKDVPFVLSYDGRSGEKEYGKPLPEGLKAKHLRLHAGRSSQATLMGKSADTVESLYVSQHIDTSGANIFRKVELQPSLFQE